MSLRLRKSTPRDLFFEDVLLPKWAHEIDVLPISILRGLGFRFSHWFFRFTVCVGRVRRSPTYAIRSHCEPLLGIIHHRRKEILELIPLRSTIKDPPREVLDQWTITLEKMLALAAGKKSCSWYADAHPSDPLWPGWPQYVKKLGARGYVLRNKGEAVDKALRRLDTEIAALKQISPRVDAGRIVK
jgi:hypothetical protein